MKIAFDYQKFCVQKSGGISKYFTNLAISLLQKKCDIKVFAPIHCNSYLNKIPKSNKFGINLPFYSAYLQEKISFINHKISKMMLLKYCPDILHETYYSPAKNAPNGCKTVITVYDMIHEKFPTLYPDIAEKTAKADAIKKADHIFCISQSTKHDLIDLNEVRPEKITVTYLGIEPASILKKYKKSHRPLTEPYLLYVGNRGPHKNFAGFIRSLKKIRSLKNYKVVVFGLFPLTEAEINLLKQEKIDQNLIFFTGGDDDKLWQFYHHAEAHVLPSLYEGFGLTALEAMACDCPVICSRTSSLPEVVGEAGEYFDPNDPSDIALAICRVINHPQRRMELIEKGRIQHKKFTWENTAEETLRVYERLVS